MELEELKEIIEELEQNGYRVNEQLLAQFEILKNEAISEATD